MGDLLNKKRKRESDVIYERYPTIYTFGIKKFNNSVNKIYQGPHTLAHVSIAHLLKDGYICIDEEQVIEPEKVSYILETMDKPLAEYPGDYINLKLAKYLDYYIEKYNKMKSSDKNSKEYTKLCNELMELHPCTTYKWFSVLDSEDDKMGQKASKDDMKGKGESKRYLAFDKNSLNFFKDNEYFLYDYLKLRLGSLENKDDVIKELLQFGEYYRNTD